MAPKVLRSATHPKLPNSVITGVYGLSPVLRTALEARKVSMTVHGGTQDSAPRRGYVGLTPATSYMWLTLTTMPSGRYHCHNNVALILQVIQYITSFFMAVLITTLNHHSHEK